MCLFRTLVILTSVAIMADSTAVSIAWGWIIPQCHSVTAGDVVTFPRESTHDVATVSTTSDSTACSNPTIVGAQADGGSFAWTAVVSKHFICSVSGHCAGGMKIRVLIGDACPATAAPTPAVPTPAAPTHAPTPAYPAASNSLHLGLSSSVAVITSMLL